MIGANLFGAPNWRKTASANQDAATFKLQLQSGELWGYPMKLNASTLPAVKAINRPLVDGESGFAFFARARPSSRAGSYVYWRPSGSDVRSENEDGDQVAKIDILISAVSEDLVESVI